MYVCMYVYMYVQWLSTVIQVCVYVMGWVMDVPVRTSVLMMLSISDYNIPQYRISIYYCSLKPCYFILQLVSIIFCSNISLLDLVFQMKELLQLSIKWNFL